VRTYLLFVLTALAEILGCWLPSLWLREGRSPWLLSLHPTASGRVYAAYGGVYVVVALLWLRVVDGVPLTARDGIGSLLALIGMAVSSVGAAMPTPIARSDKKGLNTPAPRR